MRTFSVVITLYNKERYIASTLKSVLAQTFEDFEIIVVNDGSEDRSLDIVSQFTDERLRIISQKNKGASNARNTGLGNANGSYIALLDGDDSWHPNYLNEIYKLTQEFPKEKVFATAVMMSYPNGYQRNACYSENIDSPEPLDFFEASTQMAVLTSSSVVFDRSIIDEIGYFDERIISGQDTDYWIRLGLKHQVVFSPKHYVYYHQIGDSLSHSRFDSKNKPKYLKWLEEEDSNPALKYFLNINRFSLALRSKMANDKEGVEFYSSYLDHNLLSRKQRSLLRLPSTLLRVLFRIKSFLEIKGVYLSIFK
ncbi:glycosyltransferase family 2 protein [Sungkyunkwania multivorans]|uniref:Glycosyltransferase family 2 protein n=1 Tax=Sungkyunkwania multivorans TaxID=1173618 RepID=A0ABW3CSD2_9FLAO